MNIPPYIPRPEIYDDMLIDFFGDEADDPMPQGKILKTKCWRCEIERLCFADASQSVWVSGLNSAKREPIPVCMKCRLETCGKTEDEGCECEVCIIWGYPAKPVDDLNDIDIWKEHLGMCWQYKHRGEEESGDEGEEESGDEGEEESG